MVKNIIKISKIPKICRERYLNLNHCSSLPLRQKGIGFSGVSNLRRGYKVAYSKLAEYMMIATLRGEGRLESANGKKYLLDGGSVIVHPPGSACAFHIEDDCWDIIWFYLAAGAPGMDNFSAVAYWHDASQFLELRAAMEGCLHEHERMYGSGDPYAEKAARNYAELTVITLNRILERNFHDGKDKLHDTADGIWLAVRQNISRNWQITELAELAGMSPSTFQRYMRKAFNCSPKQMLLNIRFEEAKHLLLSTAYPLKTIAERLGYSDEFAFSYAFKRHCGMSPRHFRNQSV
ncbi:MAG: helix-turn-helix domain-containing protein [Victivallaceae bacterium]|nr:helix-turn-helix domain-containing protein [Victivallaceae bacterium]